MSQLAGIALALVLLAVYVWALTQIWRAPFRALGVLVAGMAFHNILIMLLLRLAAPSTVVRVVQAWKEGILLLLLVLALAALLRTVRAGRLPALTALDWAMAAFALLAVIYTVLPPGLLGGSANTQQRISAASFNRVDGPTSTGSAGRSRARAPSSASSAWWSSGSCPPPPGWIGASTCYRTGWASPTTGPEVCRRTSSRRPRKVSCCGAWCPPT
jgi:hypothetical protein